MTDTTRHSGRLDLAADYHNPTTLWMQVGDGERLKLATVKLNGDGKINPHQLIAIMRALADEMHDALDTGDYQRWLKEGQDKNT